MMDAYEIRTALLDRMPPRLAAWATQDHVYDRMLVLIQSAALPRRIQVRTTEVLDRRHAPIEDLAADYNARGLTASTAYGQFVRDRDLRPEVDVHGLRRVMERAGSHVLRAASTVEERSFRPTHFDTIRQQEVMVTPLSGRNVLLWADGATGSDLGALSARYLRLGSEEAKRWIPTPPEFEHALSLAQQVQGQRGDDAWHPTGGARMRLSTLHRPQRGVHP